LPRVFAGAEDAGSEVGVEFQPRRLDVIGHAALLEDFFEQPMTAIEVAGEEG
jgi:hypothetical protein